MANVPQGGDLMVAKYQDGVVQGDDKGFGTYTNHADMGTTVGASLEPSAINRMGSVDGAESDPMFAKFKYEDDQPNKSTGSEAPESVQSQQISGAGSDPIEMDFAQEQKG